MKLNAEDKLRRARVKLQRESPFFSYLAMSLKLKETEICPSLGVDIDGNLHYNPDYVEKLGNEEVKGVLCHEVLHLALSHLLRRDSRQKFLWNLSSDFVVNLVVKENGFSLPDGVCYDRKFKDMASEEVYAELKKEVDKKKRKMKGKGDDFEGDKSGKGGGGSGGEGKEEEKEKEEGGGGSGGEDDEVKKEMEKEYGEQFDEHIEPEEGEEGEGSEEEDGERKKHITEEEAERKAREWEKRLVEAHRFSEQRGKAPAGMERHIEEVLQNKIDWKSLLQKYIQKEIPYDFTWERPSRKSRTTGVYLPDVQKESMEVVVAVDTSGSISDERLQEFVSEMVGIKKSYQNVRMDVIVADADVQDTYELKNGNLSKFENMEMKGRGGTDHRPVFKHIEKNIRNPRILVALTDGYSAFPDDSGTVRNVIWAVPESGAEDEKFPFGKVVRIPD